MKNPDQAKINFKNVFSDAIETESQIKETLIETGPSFALKPTRIVELLKMEQGEKSQLKKSDRSFVRQVRHCEEQCKVSEDHSLLDFSIRATSSLSDDIERAYFEAR